MSLTYGLTRGKFFEFVILMNLLRDANQYGRVLPVFAGCNNVNACVDYK